MVWFKTSLAESPREGYGSKRAVLLMMIIIISKQNNNKSIPNKSNAAY
jgi:hypothetical protein